MTFQPGDIITFRSTPQDHEAFLKNSFLVSIHGCWGSYLIDNVKVVVWQHSEHKIDTKPFGLSDHYLTTCLTGSRRVEEVFGLAPEWAVAELVTRRLS